MLIVNINVIYNQTNISVLLFSYKSAEKLARSQHNENNETSVYQVCVVLVVQKVLAVVIYRASQSY